MGTLFVAGLGAEVEGPPVARWLIRGSSGCLFGGAAAWLLALAVETLRGRRPANVPAALLARCVGCGLPDPVPGTPPARCPLCGQPSDARAAGWACTREPLGELFVVPIGLGVLGFGVFITIGPLLEGHAGIPLIVVCLAVGLLIAGVGAAVTYGGLALILERVRARGAWRYEDELDTAAETTNVCVDAEATGAGLRIRGGLDRHDDLPMDRVTAPLPTLSEPERAFVTAVATLHRAGHVDLTRLRVIEWQLEPVAGGAPTYTRVDRTSIEAGLLGKLADVDHPLAPVLFRARSLAAIWAVVREDPALIGQLAPAADVDEADPVIQALAQELAGQAVH
ncbi:MAG: hypothetical protein V4850_12945 [Myxococcota bacterium]